MSLAWVAAPQWTREASVRVRFKVKVRVIFRVRISIRISIRVRVIMRSHAGLIIRH